MLHRQNKLYSTQGLPKEYMIYVRVLRKHWKSKRQHFYLWVKNINVSKITHCPCMSLCSMPIALWHIFWNPKLFSNLLSWIWTARLEGNRPVRSQFLFKRNLLTVNSARLDWVYVLARVPPEESRFLREITQNNLLFPVTVLPTAT